MGEENHDRQLRRARATYIGAKNRFLAALEAFDNSGTPMDPGPDLEPYPWTDEQWANPRELRSSDVGHGRRAAHLGRVAAGVADQMNKRSISQHSDKRA
jgi:hypothetical protein